jgi:hypothetical protein
VIPVYSLLLVCVLPLQHAHETAGALGIRHSPRPLWGDRFFNGSGAWRGEIVKVCLELEQTRHSGAMRSIEPGISRFRVWSCGPSRNDGVWLAMTVRLFEN